MSAFNKILLTTSAICYLALVSACVVYGQSKTIQPYGKNKHKITLGFRTGRDVLFHTQPYTAGKNTPIRYAVSSTLVLTKPLNNHLKLESGLRYSVVQNTISPLVMNKSSNAVCANPYSLTVPVTIQYYFLPEKSRVRPYLGSGLRYNFNTNQNNITPFYADAHTEYPDQTGTKYISILFTQGITFEINTKIQINQAFHFIPDNANKTFGIDIGIGFTIP